MSVQVGKDECLHHDDAVFRIHSFIGKTTSHSYSRKTPPRAKHFNQAYDLQGNSLKMSFLMTFRETQDVLVNPTERFDVGRVQL